MSCIKTIKGFNRVSMKMKKKWKKVDEIIQIFRLKKLFKINYLIIIRYVILQFQVNFSDTTLGDFFGINVDRISI